MRELILNHCSFSDADRESCISLLDDFCVSIAKLINSDFVEKFIRVRKELYEIRCHSGESLYELFQDYRSRGNIENYGMLMSLLSKVSFLEELDDNLIDRFQRCENRELDDDFGEPLVLSAITGNFLSSLRTADVWRKSEIKVEFDELKDDESIETVSEVIDNVSSEGHSEIIIERLRRLVGNATIPEDVWSNKHILFPSLHFSPDIEKQVKKIQKVQVSHILDRLIKINETAALWRTTKGNVPPWKCVVDPEKANTLAKPEVRAARMFNSSLENEKQLFEWHTRIPSYGRIHLRFKLEDFVIEIGYIGEHLRLV